MRNSEIRHWGIFTKKDVLYLARRDHRFPFTEKDDKTVIDGSRYSRQGFNIDRYRSASRKEIVLEYRIDPETGYKWGKYKNYKSVVSEYTEIKFE